MPAIATCLSSTEANRATKNSYTDTFQSHENDTWTVPHKDTLCILSDVQAEVLTAWVNACQQFVVQTCVLSGDL